MVLFIGTTVFRPNQITSQDTNTIYLYDYRSSRNRWGIRENGREWRQTKISLTFQKEK
jgi:hypothetical protein